MFATDPTRPSQSRVHAFTQHYRKFARMKRFPDGQASFARLGVRAGEELVTFDADAPDAVIRDAIIAPRANEAQIGVTPPN